MALSLSSSVITELQILRHVGVITCGRDERDVTRFWYCIHCKIYCHQSVLFLEYMTYIKPIYRVWPSKQINNTYEFSYSMLNQKGNPNDLKFIFFSPFVLGNIYVYSTWRINAQSLFSPVIGSTFTEVVLVICGGLRQVFLLHLLQVVIDGVDKRIIGQLCVQDPIWST